MKLPQKASKEVKAPNVSFMGEIRHHKSLCPTATTHMAKSTQLIKNSNSAPSSNIYRYYSILSMKGTSYSH